MKKIENPIQELTSRIEKYIENGGSIYDPRRKLTYYDYLNHVRKRLAKENNTEYTNVDIYKMCGFDFDSEYANYLEIVSDLNDLSDKDNYVDKLFNFKETKPQTYGKLCTLSIKYKTCLYDFLVIVTGFRLKNANINLDYEKALIERLKKAYPTHNLSGIKHENNELYEMLRHVRRYRYPTLSMNELIEMYGFHNDHMAKESTLSINEEAVLRQLDEQFPDKKINSSLLYTTSYYYDLIKLSILHKKGLVTYLNSKGYTYSQGNLVSRLALMKVEEKSRYNFLINKKKEFYDKHNAENLTDKERFHLNIDLIKEIAKIDNVEEFIKQDDFEV